MQSDVFVEQYREKGYLPQAIINYIAFLGWNPGTDKEIFDMQELINEFSLERIHKAGAIFDPEKLYWLNGVYIRNENLDNLTDLCLKYFKDAKYIEHFSDNSLYKSKKFKTKSNKIIDFDYLKKVVKTEQTRIKLLSEITDRTDFFFVDSELSYDPDILIYKKMNIQQVKESLEYNIEIINDLSGDKLKEDLLQDHYLNLINNSSYKTGELLWPLRVALTGLKSSPGPFEIIPILGKELCIKRLNFALNLLK